ncbi:hypothetical protein [Oceanibacterium hippocampi]|uniref:Uncharacterized protein n=1 Tax=Oceanibacterium hippocampi TaxID=745714 RepID=A0A1Y5S7B1_9PROT|nr:hypothetical protein [Oceanibacterium hippocampi]SLN33826.1 hypothetical protein OCH7691_01300 [Oceanibacterium hippocampi]
MAIRLPADDALAERIVAALRALPATVRSSLFHAMAQIDRYPVLPRERVAVLNDRYDVHVVRLARGGCHAVLVCEPDGRDIVLAGITGSRPSARRAATLAAVALDVPVLDIHLDAG